MKYSQIDFNIENFNDDEKLSIKQFIEPFEEYYFEKLLELFPGIMLNEIRITITDDIWRDIKEFYKSFGKEFESLPPKGINHLIKIAAIEDDVRYFWGSKYLDGEGVKMAYRVVLEDILGASIKKKYGFKDAIFLDKGIEEIIRTLFNIWKVNTFSKKALSQIFGLVIPDFADMEDLTFSFKKNIKSMHYEYQANLDRYKFLSNAIFEFEIYFRRILSSKTEKNLTKLEEFETEIIELIGLVEDSLADISKIHDETIAKAQSLILRILVKCDIEIFELKNEGEIGFKIKSGPKKLFLDMVDTHPRIICFVDILGFKSLIEEYETMNSSLVLKKLKSAFDLAIKVSFDLLLNIFDDDFKNEIEYRMFSDCITISLPYIEYGIDVKIGFFKMSLILNSLQQTFMKSGFYLRGHVTLGTYYSDENMLFSGGLVEAYMNESKTLFPVISVNKKIVERLKESTDLESSYPSMKNILIEHSSSESQNNIILNPLFTLNFYKNIDEEFNRLINLGFQDSDKDLKFPFKNFVDNEMRKNGFQDLESELHKDIDEILKVLLEKFNDQLSIYQDLKVEFKIRNVAGKVIEKHKFLYALLHWIAKEEDSLFFKYLELPT